jgi:hypothetical protein
MYLELQDQGWRRGIIREIAKRLDLTERAVNNRLRIASTPDENGDFYITSGKQGYGWRVPGPLLKES